MRNKVLIIFSILILVVGQISEETASQRTQITLSFGQVNDLEVEYQMFYFYGFTTKEVDENYEFNFLVKLIKTETEESETGEINCFYSSSNSLGDTGSATVVFACYNYLETNFDSVEIVSSDNVAGIPSDTILLNPKLTDDLIKDEALYDFYSESPAPQLVGQPVIDYKKVGNGLLKFTINLRQPDQNIKVGQSFDIKLPYPSGIFLKFTITEINELTMKLNCEIEGEVIDQRLYVEQTTIVVDRKYLFILPGFITNSINTNGTELQNDEEEEESEKEQIEESEKEQEEEIENEQTEELEKEQIEESEKEKTEEQEGEQKEEPEKEQKEEPEKEQAEVAEKEQMEESEKEKTEEQEGEQIEESEKEQTEELEKEQIEESEKEKTEKEQTEEPEGEQTEEPEGEQMEEPEKEQTEEPEKEKTEEPEKEQMEEPQKEKTEEPEKEQTEEPEKEQKEKSEKEQIEEPEEEQTEESEKEQAEEPEKEQKEKSEKEQKEEPEKEQTEEPEKEQTEEPQKEKTEEPEKEQKEKPEIEKTEEPEKEQTEEPGKEKADEEPEEKPSEKEDTTEQVSTTSKSTESSTHESTNSTINESTEQATTQNVTPTNGITYEPTTDTISEEEEEESIRTIEEAKKISELTISFRQLTGFKFTGGVISFNFLSLITQSLSKGKTITLLVNLIGINGMDEEATEITCTLGENVEVTDNESKQAIFLCLRSGLNESKGYTSFRLNSSDDIAGIPTEDEIALNPVLTDEAISNNEIKNYTADSSVPPSFVFDTIDLQNCENDGKFAIKGSLSGVSTIASNKFTIPLTYPEGTSITCTFEGENLQCIGDKELSGTMILEQAIVADKTEELFTLKNISFNNMNCNNGLLKEASKKINVNISFRQVSHIQKESNGLSFLFAAFVNVDLPASYTIPMNVIVIINGKKVEKIADCTLNEAVTSSGTAVQGDFNCLVALESNENVAPEDLTISTNNDNIGGCSELTKEEASPKLTDDAIEESKNKPDLGKVLDYSLEENKGKIPPSFEISTLNMDKCESKGKLTLIGTFLDDINEEMTFDISFTFPASTIKCTVEKATKGQQTEISCKMQKVKKGAEFRDFVLEPKLLKKKNKEMFYIKRKTFNLGSTYKCENFNELKLKKAKARINSPFTFLQVGKPPSYSRLFFMALTRKNTEAVFTQTQIFTVTLKIQTSRRRRLDIQELEDLNITCVPGNSTDNTGSFDCSGSANGDLVSLDIENDKIAGQTENVKILENPNPDYSKKEALVVYDSLPSVTITNVTSQNCSIYGTYKVEAYSASDLNLTEEKDNVTILFSTPDSSGNCIIEVPSNKRNLTINCDNTESFTASEMIIPAQTIYEKDDTTPLFKIASDYIVPSPFACAIGDNSYKNKTAISQESTSTSWGKRYFRNGSSGLSGGAIAGIVIALVVAFAIIAVLIVYTRKFISKPPKSANYIVDNSSTIHNLQMNRKV